MGRIYPEALALPKALSINTWSFLKNTTHQSVGLLLQKPLKEWNNSQQDVSNYLKVFCLMASPIKIQVENIDHLGLVAGMIDQIGIVEQINQLVGEQPGEKVSPGHAVKAMIL